MRKTTKGRALNLLYLDCTFSWPSSAVSYSCIQPFTLHPNCEVWFSPSPLLL